MTRQPGTDQQGAWPALPYAERGDTLATVHMGSQIVGTMRPALVPPSFDLAVTRFTARPAPEHPDALERR